MSKPISLMPGMTVTGAFSICSPRPGDTIGGALRAVFDRDDMPDDISALLKGLDHIEPVPVRN